MALELLQKQGGLAQEKEGAEKKSLATPVEAKESQMSWQSPAASALITSPFGPRDMSKNKGGGSSDHKGIDLRAAKGTAIVAAADGKAKVTGGSYNTVEVVHSSKLTTRYLHSSSIKVKNGQEVKKGDTIALAGGKGPKGVNQFNSHLHFEVHQDGNRIDPESFLISNGVALARKQGLPARKDAAETKSDSSDMKGNALTPEKEKNAISWYETKGFNADLIKRVQAAIGANETGKMDADGVQAVGKWQADLGMRGDSLDGRFGVGSAQKIGDKELEADIRALSDKKTTIGTGEGINPAPGFRKQTNYPDSPYVSKEHYDEMKKEMGDTPYSKWNAGDKKISGIYSKATTANDRKESTIKSSGCGVTSYANLMNITPTESAEMAMNEGTRKYKSGTEGSFFTSKGGKQLFSAQAALNEVAEGKYLICSMGTGNWCQSQSKHAGHYILVYGYANNKVYVSDPNSTDQSRAEASARKFLDTYKHGYTFKK
ncbi:MAG: peptidoglycan DD-metalloendopeptidase family protein [Proteobacteria bacterium]|nr:peptidoglycan DD-metalloendopeptidase family protein [Pseudomonadota bacterium]